MNGKKHLQFANKFENEKPIEVYQKKSQRQGDLPCRFLFQKDGDSCPIAPSPIAPVSCPSNILPTTYLSQAKLSQAEM